MSDESYRVGYCRPPQHQKWKKGQSGNPKGRPRRDMSVSGMLGRILGERISVTSRGRRRRMTRFEYLMRVAVDLALEGKTQDLKTVLGELHLMEAREAREPKPGFEPADLKVLDALYKRLAADAVRRADAEAAAAKPEEPAKEDR